MKKFLRKSLEEELSFVPLQIKGNIPEWIQGTLIRNGPAKFETKDGHKEVAHWFDGLAMLHSFSFEKGKIYYTNRFIRSFAYHQIYDHNSISYIGFAEDPCTTIFKRFFSYFFSSDNSVIHNADVHVTKLANKFAALTETPLPVEFDVHTLDTLGVVDYQDNLPKHDCWNTVHAHYDLQRNETIGYMVKFSWEGSYLIYRIADNTLTREIIAEIPVKNPAYMHTFAVTENYVILTEFPLVVNPLDPLLKGKGFITNYSWKPARGTNFIIVDRKSGRIKKQIATDPFFAFHHINAYEDNDQIIMDIVVYENADIVMALADYGKGVKLPNSTITRFQFSLNSEKISKEEISNCQLELPRIHSEYDGKPYTFVYGPDLHETFSPKDIRNIYKVNVNDGKFLSWHQAGCNPGEAVFLKNPSSSDEDDGIIMSVILDNVAGNSFLLLLNATTFEEIARAEIPHPIPGGLHGAFYKT